MAGPLILLVDDFEDARDMYASYLTFSGCRVIVAEDGTTAIEQARATRPDVILMDLRMPGISGTDVMRELRQDPSFAAVPIVALTAHAMDSEIKTALRDGFDAVIAKPCLPDELFTKITALLAQWRSDRDPPADRH